MHWNTSDRRTARDIYNQVCVRTLVRIGYGDVQKLSFGLWAIIRVHPKHRRAPYWDIHRDFAWRISSLYIEEGHKFCVSVPKTLAQFCLVLCYVHTDRKTRSESLSACSHPAPWTFISSFCFLSSPSANKHTTTAQAVHKSTSWNQLQSVRLSVRDKTDAMRVVGKVRGTIR